MSDQSIPAIDHPVPATRQLSYQELDILHCLRGFCAFYVVVFHAKYILWAGGREYLQAFPRAGWNLGQYLAFALDMASSAGYEMVIFFFVLSGFFIRYAQLRKHRAPVAFYINRIVRIYPPYLFSALLAAGILVVIVRVAPQMLTGQRELNASLRAAWQNLQHFDLGALGRALVFLPESHNLFTGYNTVYWSLLPEALFYLLVPLAFWRIKFYYLLSGIGFAVGVGAGLRHAPLGLLPNFLLIYNFYFAVGVALYDAVVYTGWLAWFRRRPLWLLGAASLALFGALVLLAILKLTIFSGVTAVLLAVLSISTLLTGKVSGQNLVLKTFHSIGIFSFSLYLYHYPLLLLGSSLLTVLTGTLVFYARFYWLAVPVVTVVCYALYWVTERASVKFFRKV